jgi:hypothetical protein
MMRLPRRVTLRAATGAIRLGPKGVHLHKILLQATGLLNH